MVFLINKKKANLGLAYSIGAIWFGSHVGGGFASGNQAWNFFGKFGTLGIIISILSMVLVGVAGREILLSAKLYRSNSYREWAKDWKKKDITAGSVIGFIMNAVMLALSIVCLICWAPIAGNTTIPILTALQNLDKTWVTIIYSIALFLAFVSTAAGAVFATVARILPLPFTAKMKGSQTGKSAVIAIAFIVITMLVSLVGLDAIVKVGYSWVGVFSVFTIIGWAIFVLIPRNIKGYKALKDSGEEE